MISRLGVVIYWACLLIALLFSTVAYLQFVETVEETVITDTPCTLSPEDQRASDERSFVDISDAGLSCLAGMGYVTEFVTETTYGEAPFWWLVCFLIALAGYAIKYILTGSKSLLPWSKENNS